MGRSAIVILLFFLFLAGCSTDGPQQKGSRAERIADERSKRNPVQKGRYDCWELSPAGDKTTSPLYILSDEIYQFGESTGRYTFNHETKIIAFTKGPLYQSGNPLIATYTPHGTPTPGGGKTLETIIEIRRQADVDAGEKRVMVQCNCTIFKY